MRLIENKYHSFVWILIGTLLLLIGRDIYNLIPDFYLSNIFRSERIQILVAYSLISSYFWVIGWQKILEGEWPGLIIASKARRVTGRLNRVVRWGLAIMLALIPALILYHSEIAYENVGAWMKLAFILFVAILIEIVIGADFPEYESDYKRFYAFMMVSFVVLVVGMFSQVTSYPFSLGWSEGNRMYDYSILFGSDRYIVEDESTISAYISSGKAFVGGLPFLYPDINIFGARLWDAFVKVVPTVVLGFLLLIGNKNGKTRLSEKILFVFWSTFFIFQGPIQANLIIVAIIVVVGVRNKNLFMGLFIVAIAGYIAYVSRWSWGYAPGIWAGMIALMNADGIAFNLSEWKKTIRPISFGLAGFIGGSLPNIISNVLAYLKQATSEGPVDFAGDSFGQELVWARLLPNSTFTPGIILGLVFALGPLIAWVYITFRKGAIRLNLLQIIGLLISMIAFAGVGVVASVKIGGGGDLHNADMLIISMALVAGLFWTNTLKILRDPAVKSLQKSAIYVLLIIPVVYTIGVSNIKSPIISNDSIVSSSLQIIQTEVYKANEVGGVLFMDARQLLTFGYIQGVPLIAEYEKKILIDYAFSSKSKYFAKFYQDLENHRFSLIISDPLNLRLSDNSRNFSNENDVWVKWVSINILKHYKILVTLEDVGIQLLVPR